MQGETKYAIKMSPFYLNYSKDSTGNYVPSLKNKKTFWLIICEADGIMGYSKLIPYDNKEIYLCSDAINKKAKLSKASSRALWVLIPTGEPKKKEYFIKNI